MVRKRFIPHFSVKNLKTAPKGGGKGFTVFVERGRYFPAVLFRSDFRPLTA